MHPFSRRFEAEAEPSPFKWKWFPLGIFWMYAKLPTYWYFGFGIATKHRRFTWRYRSHLGWIYRSSKF